MKTRKSDSVGSRKSLRYAAMVAALGLSFLPVTAAARNVTLPHTETFDTLSSITDIARSGPAGATVTWLPNVSWDGGGAVRIAPVTNTEGYGGIGGFTGFSATRLNLRFLIKIGSNFAGVATMDKLVIINRAAGVPSRRAMIFDAMNNVDEAGGARAMVYSPCLGTVCVGPDPSRPRSNPFYVTRTHNVDEWFVFEYEVDLPNKRLNLYIWSRDGRYSGLYASRDMATGLDNEGAFNSASDPVINVEGIGWYWHPPEERAPLSVRDANTYIMIDDVAIDNRFIGPPRNFLGNSPPSAPRAR